MRCRLLAPWLFLLCACPVDGAPSSDDEDAATDGSEQSGSDAADDPSDAGSSDAAAQREAGAEMDAGSDAASAAQEPTLSELMQEYRSWSPRQDMPQSISAQIFGLCRLPSAAEEMFAESSHGKERFLQDWLNAAAKQTFDGKDTPFPVGAAIVKEKLVYDGPGEFTLVARGLMIKRAAGFDPEHGDWEFGYWEPDAGLAGGTEAAGPCGDCHAGAPTDFVFLDQRWRLP